MPRLLLRLLAGVHLVAFVSLWVQVDGLVGSRGILPARDFFGYLERVLGAGAFDRFVNVPSLLWLGSGDAALHLLCAAGVLLSLLAIAGMVTAPVFAALWICYLSLVWGGQTFLAFQWDTLLLEATLCAVVLAPLGWPLRIPAGAPAGDGPRSLAASVRAAFRVAPNPAAARPGMWLFRLLVVKLMFLSGAVKLLSLDPTWWRLTALDVHYFTQPLPVAASWYAHHLPEWFHRLSVLIMFGVELGAAWLVFFRRLRLPAVGALLLLQFLIAATGNYGFFNLLTAVLCLSWLHRPTFAGPSRPGKPPAASAAAPHLLTGTAGTRFRWLAATMILLLSLSVTARELTRSLPRGPETPATAVRLAGLLDRVLVDPAAPVLRAITPFRSINGYGLFRAMTTSRPEILVETSADGVTWSELAFRFKPGDLDRPPPAAFPHMPRLDWQMWFAALDPAGADWLGSFVERLFESEPAVLRLLGEASRQVEPPRYVRLRLYDYRFSEPGAGAPWWRREFLYDLSPVLEREAFVR